MIVFWTWFMGELDDVFFPLWVAVDFFFARPGAFLASDLLWDILCRSHRRTRLLCRRRRALRLLCQARLIRRRCPERCLHRTNRWPRLLSGVRLSSIRRGR